MRLRGEAGNEVTQQQRNVEEMLERAARTEQRDAAQELADKTQARPNVAQTPRRMMAGIACTLVGGVLWGVNGSVSKILMEQYDASPMWVACVREIFAGLIFLACGAIGSPKAMRKAFTTVRDYPMYLVTALTCVTLVQVAYLFSIHWTNAGTATVLQTVNLLMVLVYVCVRGRRKPTVREVVGVALAFAGVWLLATGGDLGALSLPLPGLLWGLADAFACACLAIIPVKLIAKYGNFVVNGITFLLSGLILTPFVRPWAHVPAFDARGWWLLVFTVVVGTFVAFWLYMAGVVRIRAMRATLFGRDGYRGHVDRGDFYAHRPYWLRAHPHHGILGALTYGAYERQERGMAWANMAPDNGFRSSRSTSRWWSCSTFPRSGCSR